MQKIPSLLSISFRPFFILAALIAALNPVIWVTSYLGDLYIPLTSVDTLFWHGHEMIFGFTGALIAGFILTASANWTGSTPYQGRSLLVLILIWLIERCSYFLPFNDSLIFIFMNLFFPTLTIMLLYKLIKFPKQRNVFIPILVGMTIGKLLHSWGHIYSHESYEIAGKHLALGLIRFIILLIAGRVIPFFTRSKIEELNISIPKIVNILSLVPVALLAIPFPNSTSKLILVALYSLAIIFNLIRQGMWLPQKTLKIPILFILHVGVAFITFGLFLELIGLFDDQVNFSQAAIHMLMAGGIGVVGIGIMTRVSLGHTGRIIKADKWIILAYLSVITGALLRVLIPIFTPDFYLPSLHTSSGIWTLGFTIFLIRFWKILMGPRFDQKS